ncbi:MAG: ThiF family adenylyltransferase [Lachnospiraceae bacterium]|nr:ThiF family adenylyltransferase [Lachnospiraceae bacterium]
MQIKVIISATLRAFTNKRSEVLVEGDTVSDVLENLIDEYPELKKSIYGEDGNLRDFVALYLGEEDISDTDKWSRTIREGEELLLLPAIAGGTPEKGIISSERRKEAALDDEEIERYSKHLMLRDIGVKGQKSIKASKVLVIGLGALGSPVVQYLAAAGVGTIGIVDFDEVSLSNLQSQVLHTRRDIHRPKTASAKDKMGQSFFSWD